jgi:aryl-phospho-beta-D-glucosidase BglC (GH1 family)
MTTATGLLPLRTKGDEFVDASGAAVRLRGVCVGGWLNMENFVSGYAANESLMRADVRAAIGDDRAEQFFDNFLDAFFDEEDAGFLAAQGFNVVRIPINYHHFESDAKPFEIIDAGFRYLDRAIEQCGSRGIYSIIDLHALPGSQNHDWHADNPTHIAAFWHHPHFQDRVANLWEAIAHHYKGNPFVGGYNLMNEPADESRQVVGPFYDRLIRAVRAIDPDHTIFLDGNTYSTEFDIFEVPWENTVYTLHDYIPSGFGRGGPYPGLTDGQWIDRDFAERKFLERSAYARKTETPLNVGEFGPTYTGDPEEDAMRRQALEDQLEIYRRHGASWQIWVYKDLGRQGLVGVRPGSPYLRQFGDFVAKKNRLAADSWGSTEVGVREVTDPIQGLIANEFPGFDPYPWGRLDFVRRLVLNIMVARPLSQEYATLLQPLSDGELKVLVESFSFRNCLVRDSLLEQLKRG